VFRANDEPVQSCNRVHRYDPEDLSLIGELMKLHRSANERFNGCVVRENLAYWDYVRYNLPNGGFWLENIHENDSRELDSSKVHVHRGNMAAFAALRIAKSGDGFVLADFFADREILDSDGGSSALREVTVT
jgi:hypothetical protein